MDWKLVASLVLERSDLPAAVLDGQRRVEMINGAMQRITGRSSSDVVGRPFADALGAPEHRREIDEHLRRVLRSGGGNLEVDLLGRDGCRIRELLSARTVGSQGRAGALLERRADANALPLVSVSEVDVYEIDVRPGSFGRTLYQWTGGERRHQPGECCSSIRYGTRELCAQCPARSVDDHHHRATSVVPVPGGDEYDIVTAEYVDGHTARIAACRVKDPILSSLVQARVARLAEQAGLSERERSVLTYLLMGRTQQDIGKILGIAPRTVKFHQRNVLRKLGADSRVDLMRFLI